MSQKLTRRQFVQTGTAAGVAIATPTTLFGQAPAVQTGVKPVVVSSDNGNVYKNGGAKTGVQLAFDMITGGADVLDALIAGVNLCELDPADTSVGFGGLPNAEGVVQLDSCCMHGPTRRAGGVSALEGVRTPSLVAKAVLENTDHHLLTGKGAQEFARHMGFKIEDDLNTDASRKLWLEWKRRIDPEHYLDPKKRGDAMMMAGLAMVRDGLIDPNHFWGTITATA
jgi:N4-(beta-N-acetylglucosaminyl)-L-asparaginase